MSPRCNLGLRNQPEHMPKPLIPRAAVHTELPDDIIGIIVVNKRLLSRTILEVLRELANFRVTVVVGTVLNHLCLQLRSINASGCLCHSPIALSSMKACRHNRSRLLHLYAAFFCCAFTFAHLARWNAEILLRAAADIVRLPGAEAVVFVAPTSTGCDSIRTFAHLACCARAILRREADDTFRVVAATTPVGWFACLTAPVPFSDSITAIA